MTKRMRIAAVMVLLTAVSAAVEAEQRYINNELYQIDINYFGKNRGMHIGQIILSNKEFSVQSDIKLSKEQWECVSSLLDRYETEKGDTFLILLDIPHAAYFVICEFTSNTKYTYWTYYAAS